MNAHVAALDQFRDRIVVVVQIEALADARFAAAERRMLAIAEGKPAGNDDGLVMLQRDLATAFQRSYEDVRRSLPDRGPTSSCRYRRSASTPTSCHASPVRLRAAIARLACRSRARGSRGSRTSADTSTRSRVPIRASRPSKSSATSHAS
jgi:hypothetical protein